MKHKRTNTPASVSSTKRKPGAPKGNTNAVKSGLYSSHTRAMQAEAFEKLAPDQLQGQIDVLRIFIDRFVRAAKPDPSHEEARDDLKTLTRASEHIAYLIRQSVYIQSLSQPLQDTDDWLAKLLGEDTPPPATPHA